ncbi:MAG: hypothetical protein OXE59_02830 [Bacteroidetes bacterium]|nr:hypothetical protein [Bacteroidota bacterium]
MIFSPKILTRLGGQIHCEEGDSPNKLILRGTLIEFEDQVMGSHVHSFTKYTDLEYLKCLESKARFNHGTDVIPKPLRAVFSKEMHSTSLWLSKLKLDSQITSSVDQDIQTISVELVLDLKRRKHVFIADLARRGILSFSSGAFQRKAKVDRKTGLIKQWHIAEISIVLTPIDSQLTIDRSKPVEDIRLLSLLFNVDVQEMIADHQDHLVQFQMLHEDPTLYNEN